MYVPQSKPSRRRVFAPVGEMAFIPFRSTLEPPVFYKNSASILFFLNFILKGKQGLGEGGGELLFLQEQDWFLEA